MQIIELNTKFTFLLKEPTQIWMIYSSRPTLNLILFYNAFNRFACQKIVMHNILEKKSENYNSVFAWWNYPAFYAALSINLKISEFMPLSSLKFFSLVK